MAGEQANHDPVAEWIRISRRDVRTARLALEGGDPENALYLCQQAVEKALEAHIHQQTGEHPPKIHNLVRLSQLSGHWDTTAEPDRQFLGDVTQFAVEARYAGVGRPDSLPDHEDAMSLLARAEEMVECLLRELK